MFSHIMVLILVLILISFAPVGNGFFGTPAEAFWIGLACYLGVLGVIVLQNYLLRDRIRYIRNFLHTIANVNLLFFLVFFLFFLSGQRILPQSHFLVAALSLTFYFLGLYLFHLTTYPYLPLGSRGIVRSSFDYASTRIRLTLPFALPFLLFSGAVDGFQQLQNVVFVSDSNPLKNLLSVAGISAVILVGIMLFFPPVVVWIWQCRPLTNPVLLPRLEKLCERSRFRHAGMKVWTVLNNSYTAGIIGVLPRFRYVMFTRKLLDALAPESIEAILAHEIGHSYRRHLVFYPIIILGMVVSATCFSMIFSPAAEEYFTLQSHIHPSPIWDVLFPFTLIVPYTLIAALYFRFVFGYFSRLFERQADLHVFELGVPSDYMRQALDQLGQLTGHSHHVPSWHHYSIHERMLFLDACSYQQELIRKHHRKVRLGLIAYSILLCVFSCFVLSPLLPNTAPYNGMTAASAKISGWIADHVNQPLRNKLARQINNKETYD